MMAAHRPRAVNEETPKIAAPAFTDAAQARMMGPHSTLPCPPETAGRSRAPNELRACAAASQDDLTARIKSDDMEAVPAISMPMVEICMDDPPCPDHHHTSVRTRADHFH
jgi:hypothetical protein